MLGFLHAQQHPVVDGFQRGHGVLVRDILQIFVHSFCFYIEQLVANTEASVDVRRAALHNFRNVDSIIAWNMLISYATGYRELKAYFKINEGFRGGFAKKRVTHAQSLITLNEINF